MTMLYSIKKKLVLLWMHLFNFSSCPTAALSPFPSCFQSHTARKHMSAILLIRTCSADWLDVLNGPYQRPHISKILLVTPDLLIGYTLFKGHATIVG